MPLLAASGPTTGGRLIGAPSLYHCNTGEFIQPSHQLFGSLTKGRVRVAGGFRALGGRVGRRLPHHVGAGQVGQRGPSLKYTAVGPKGREVGESGELDTG
eukprot:1184820-Prorocentrum_minimum.AAC.4